MRPDSDVAPRRLGAARALLAVALVALLVRIIGLSMDLPFIYNADEPTNLAVVDTMVSNADANPRFFNYPSLLLYLQALVHLDGPLLSWLPGDREAAPTAMVLGSWVSSTPTAVLVHRGLSVALGTVLVGLVWLTTRRLTSGLLPAAAAATLVALSPTLIAQSRIVTPDILAATLVALTCLLAVRLQQSGSLPAHLLAGLSVGLATSAKYNAVLLAVAVVTASLLCTRPGLRRRVGLPLAGAAAVTGFLLTTPYALLDRGAFLAALRFEREHYSTGHAGMEGNTLTFYGTFLVRHEGVLVALAFAAAVLFLLRRRTGDQWRPAAVLLAFPLVYGAVVSTLPVRNDQTILLVLPPLAVLAGLAVPSLRTAAAAPRWSVAAVAMAALAYGAWTTLPEPGPTTYEASQAWLEERAAPDAAVVVESYAPWLDPGRYEIQARTRLIDGPLPAADFVIASEAMYGRFLDDPQRYPEQAAAYSQLFGELSEVAAFAGSGPTLRVFRGRKAAGLTSPLCPTPCGSTG